MGEGCIVLVESRLVPDLVWYLKKVTSHPHPHRAYILRDGDWDDTLLLYGINASGSTPSGRGANFWNECMKRLAIDVIGDWEYIRQHIGNAADEAEAANVLIHGELGRFPWNR